MLDPSLSQSMVQGSHHLSSGTPWSRVAIISSGIVHGSRVAIISSGIVHGSRVAIISSGLSMVQGSHHLIWVVQGPGKPSSHLGCPWSRSFSCTDKCKSHPTNALVPLSRPTNGSTDSNGTTVFKLYGEI